jgi:hypothetical protein
MMVARWLAKTKLRMMLVSLRKSGHCYLIFGKLSSASELPDTSAAVRARACAPIHFFTALRATPFPFLLYQPILDTVFL